MSVDFEGPMLTHAREHAHADPPSRGWRGRLPWFLRSGGIYEEQRAISSMDLWGSGDAEMADIRGDSVSSALTLAPVFAATRLISDAVASLPLGAYREVDGRKETLPTPALFADPTMFGGRFEWTQRLVNSLLLRGNAYGLITAWDYRGYPRQIEWLHPDEVHVGDDMAIRRPEWYWLGRKVDPWVGRDSQGELVHIPWYPMPGRVLGLSPIKAFALTIEGGLYAQKFGRDFFKNGGVPSSVFESDQQIDQEQAEKIKSRLRSATKNREPLVIGAGAKYKPISIAPEESQFLESIRATATVVASIYGIYPAEMIGGDTKSSNTYANVEQASIDLATNTLLPPVTKLEQHFTTFLPRPQFADIDLDARARADRKTRYETHAIALDKGFKDVAEVREEEGLGSNPALEQAPEQHAPADEVPPGDEQGRGRVVRLPRVVND